MNLINKVPRNLLPRGFLEHGTPVTPPMLEVEFAPEFLINLRVSDLFNLPGETVLMTPEISSKVSEGTKEWLEKLKSHETPLAHA